MQKQFKELLHRYKVDVFHKMHDKRSIEEVTKECLHSTEEILKEKFQFHFHRLPDANRAEIINMINNYVREAVLPPVVERLVMRITLVEKRMDALVRLNEQLLELLSHENVSG